MIPRTRLIEKQRAEAAARNQAKKDGTLVSTDSTTPPTPVESPLRVDHIHPVRISRDAVTRFGTKQFPDESRDDQLKVPTMFAIVRHRGRQFKVMEDDLLMIDNFSRRADIGEKIVRHNNQEKDTKRTQQQHNNANNTRNNIHRALANIVPSFVPSFVLVF